MAFSNEPSSETYDLIIVGTGFAGSFFLSGYLRRAPATARVLVLERGPLWTHEMQIAKGTSSPFDATGLYKREGSRHKSWWFNLSFGGGSNCWWSNAPRFRPSDFETKTRFGKGRDWPISYDDLSAYYDQVEAAMSLSGQEAPWPFPRSGPYPQPPHNLNDPERLLKAAYPTAFFNAPTGRARTPTSGRNVCCANGVCNLCPIDAKFTIQNSFMAPYRDPRVEVVVEAEVVGVDVVGGIAKGVWFKKAKRERMAKAGLVVLAANAIFNPVLLQRSGLDHPMVGKRLHEQVGLLADIMLRDLNSFQGSTSVTGHGYMLYDDDRRRDVAGCLIETWNVGLLRGDVGRWRQVLPVRMVFEDIPSEDNHVKPDPEGGDQPIVHYQGHSDYTERAIRRAKTDLERIMAPLPVEDIQVSTHVESSEAHIMGTTVMGDNPADSVVDRNCMHHVVRNLLVLGGSTFPVSGPANPTLTLSAQALRAADKLLSSNYA